VGVERAGGWGVAHNKYHLERGYTALAWAAPRPDPLHIVLWNISNNPMTFRLRSRGSFIAAMVLMQALMIGLGLFGGLEALRSGLAARAREQVLNEAAQALMTLSAASVSPSEHSEPRSQPGSEIHSSEWASRLLTLTKLGSFSEVTMISSDGEMLVRNSAGVRFPNLVEQGKINSALLCLYPTGDLVPLKDFNPGTVVSGEDVSQGGESRWVSVIYNPSSGCKFIAYTDYHAVRSAERNLSGETLLLVTLIGTLVLMVTIGGSVLLVRRYDTIVMRMNRQLEQEAERRTRRGLAIRNGLVFGLAKLADYRDTDTGKHLERICKYCEVLANGAKARFPEMDRAWIERLKLASSMHDIGKVGIPDAILLKPGALTPDERALMERHTQIGAETLSAIRQHVGEDDLLSMSVEVALCHHERYDGTGYPNRLCAESIPLCARLVALADVYDALTSRRVYKEAFSHAKACEIICNSAGSHFDPQVVAAFVGVASEFDHIRGTHQASDAELCPHLVAITEALAAPRLAA
jgi:HD-GYP domain-containing protein (c-di-GMP phosphodiesterase class II)